MSLGVPELAIILVVILLLFGATRLPKLARSVGQASKEFRSGLEEGAPKSDADDAGKGKAADSAKPASPENN